MAGGVEYSNRVISDVQGLSGFEGAVRLSHSGRGKSHPQRLLGQAVNEKLIVGMHPQRSAEFLAPRGVVIDVIEVAVRVPDGGQRVAVAQQFAHALPGRLAVDGRIDDHDLAGRVVDDKIKIVGQRPHDKGFDL